MLPMNDAFVKPSSANAHSGLPILFTCVLYFWLRQYRRMIAAATELFDPQGISTSLRKSFPIGRLFLDKRSGKTAHEIF